MLKTTEYFKFMKQRPDRAPIKDEWIEQVINHPVHEEIQSDKRIRRWAKIEELNENTLLDLDADGSLVAMTLEHAKNAATLAEFSYRQVTLAA